MNTGQSHVNASLEVWFRSLEGENFSTEPITPFEVYKASRDIPEHNMDEGPRDNQERLPTGSRALALETHQSNLAVLLRDDPQWLPHLRSLRRSDHVLLLAPLVSPRTPDLVSQSDPFEIFGTTLQQEGVQSRPTIHHQPYYRDSGMQSLHGTHIKLSTFIILCCVTNPGETILREIGELAFHYAEYRPCVVVVCCSPIDINQYIQYPTVILTDGYSPEALQATAELLFGENTQSRRVQSILPPPRTPRVWRVDLYDEAQDSAGVYNLWQECVSRQFALDHQTFAKLLDRGGYAKHYVVRDVQQGHIIGFCATYFTYVDRTDANLEGFASIFTHPQHRRRGVGLTLHNHAVAELQKIGGTTRIRLGSAFPRLLYGPPFETLADENMAWISKRRWQVSNDSVRDLLLDCEDWAASTPLPNDSDVSFRACRIQEREVVEELANRISVNRGRTGWYEEYHSLMNTADVKDVLVGEKDGNIIAAALTFTPGGNRVSMNIPWPAQIGDDVGGVTCIAVDENISGEAVLELLDACIQKLKAQGMARIFMDAVTDSDYATLSQHGFKEWARYRNVWKDVASIART